MRPDLGLRRNFAQQPQPCVEPRGHMPIPSADNLFVYRLKKLLNGSASACVPRHAFEDSVARMMHRSAKVGSTTAEKIFLNRARSIVERLDLIRVLEAHDSGNF